MLQIDNTGCLTKCSFIMSSMQSSIHLSCCAVPFFFSLFFFRQDRWLKLNTGTCLLWLIHATTQNMNQKKESPLKPKSIAYIKQYEAWISHQKVCVFTHVWNQRRKRMGHTAETQRPVDGIKKQH